MKGSTALLLVVALVVVLLLLQPSSSSAARPPATDPMYGPYSDWFLHNPPAATSGSSAPVADACKKVYSTNDPAKYVGTSDQRVAAVSTANSALSYVNCGAVGLAEKGFNAAKNFFGRIF